MVGEGRLACVIKASILFWEMSFPWTCYVLGGLVILLTYSLIFLRFSYFLKYFCVAPVKVLARKLR